MALMPLFSIQEQDQAHQNISRNIERVFKINQALSRCIQDWLMMECQLLMVIALVERQLKVKKLEKLSKLKI
jgi:hypothetical protein